MQDDMMTNALGGLTPTTPSLSPLAIAFEAGRRSMRPQVLRWRTCASACIALTVAVTLFPMLIKQSPTRGPVSVPIVAQAAVDPPETNPDQAFSLRNAVLERGLDAFPPASTGRISPVGIQDKSLRGDL